MKLCVGTSKGIVVLDAERKGKPLMVLADPPSVWCMAQDCRDPGTIYAGSVDHAHMGSARGRVTLARSNDGGRTWADITPGHRAQRGRMGNRGAAGRARRGLYRHLARAAAAQPRSRPHVSRVRRIPQAAGTRPLEFSAAAARPARPLDRLRPARPDDPLRWRGRRRRRALARPRRELRAAQQRALRRRPLHRGRSAKSQTPLRDHRRRLLLSRRTAAARGARSSAGSAAATRCRCSSRPENRAGSSPPPPLGRRRFGRPDRPAPTR